MTIASWPSTLPPPAVEFASQLASGQSENDASTPAVRNRRMPERENSFSFYLTEDEFAAWRTFFDDTLCGGTAFFSADWLTIAGLSESLLECYARLADHAYEVQRIDTDPIGYWHKSWMVSARFEIIRVEEE
jgi:hypothetical protein